MKQAQGAYSSGHSCLLNCLILAFCCFKYWFNLPYADIYLLRSENFFFSINCYLFLKFQLSNRPKAEKELKSI